jgi:uncharacterized membrane protein
MAALVFVCTYINIQIPLPGLNVMIHLGNVACILSALILGAIPGGFSAGVGSFLFDLTNPLYIASSPFTLIFKFLMGFVCGIVANSKGRNANNTIFNILGAVLGLITYIILYLSKTFIANMVIGVDIHANLILLAQASIVSIINAVLAIIIAVPLSTAINKALNKNGILSKIKF